MNSLYLKASVLQKKLSQIKSLGFSNSSSKKIYKTVVEELDKVSKLVFLLILDKFMRFIKWKQEGLISLTFL